MYRFPWGSKELIFISSRVKVLLSFIYKFIANPNIQLRLTTVLVKMNTDASSDKVEEQDQDENDAELEGDEDTEGYRISHRYNDVLQGTYDGEMLASRFDGQGGHADRSITEYFCSRKVLYVRFTGTYTSSQGKYVGSFYNGHFHGDGVLYVTGGKFVGKKIQ
jgi:hypothetical protein